MRGPHVVLMRRGIRVTVSDVSDPAIRARVDSAARQTLRHLSGKWDVSLRRSTGSDDWRLRLRGASGQHVTCFDASIDDLPRQVVARLDAFLEYVRHAPRRAE